MGNITENYEKITQKKVRISPVDLTPELHNKLKGLQTQYATTVGEIFSALLRQAPKKLEGVRTRNEIMKSRFVKNLL